MRAIAMFHMSNYVAALAAQNLILYSEQLDQSGYWAQNGVTVTANQATDVTSGLTLDQINYSSSFSNLMAFITVTPNTQYTLSFDGKRGTITEGYLNIQDNTNSAGISTNNNFWTLLNSSTPARVSYTFTTPSGCVQIYISFTNFTALGTLFLGRMQLNTGATAKPYATTTTTIVP